MGIEMGVECIDMKVLIGCVCMGGEREGMECARTCRAPTSTASIRGLVPSAAQMGVKAAVGVDRGQGARGDIRVLLGYVGKVCW